MLDAPVFIYFFCTKVFEGIDPVLLGIYLSTPINFFKYCSSRYWNRKSVGFQREFLLENDEKK